MNENDKGGAGRRRSSRRRGNRSGKAPEAIKKFSPQDGNAQGRISEQRKEAEVAEHTRPERKGRLERNKNRNSTPERLRWSPPRTAAPNLPKPECPRCGLPIEDFAAAVNDHETGSPAHFDCIIARISDSEHLSEGDKVVYIGGGRFGIIHFDSANDLKKFQIKKTVQWEEKDKRASWRRDVADQYSST